MFENHRAKTTIILLGIIVVAVMLSVSAFMFTTTPSITHTQSSGSVKAPQPVQRGPIAPSLIMWGNQTTLEHATNVTGMSWVSLPTQVPSNLILAPIRVKNNSDVTTISAIYTPPGVSTSDNVTNDQVGNAGGFSITYWKQIGGSGANQTGQMEVMAQQFPNVNFLDVINGHQSIVRPNEIMINVGNCMGETNCWLMIDIGSRTFNSTELRPIAQSIGIPPAGSSDISLIALNSLYSSSTFVSANSSIARVGVPIIFRAVVNDTDQGTKTPILGITAWNDGGAGGRFAIRDGGPNISICSVTNATLDSYQCTATYTPSKTGQITLTATYYGDTTHRSSSGSLTLKVS